MPIVLRSVVGSLLVYADETSVAVTKELVDLGQLSSGRPAKITLLLSILMSTKGLNKHSCKRIMVNSFTAPFF